MDKAALGSQGSILYWNLPKICFRALFFLTIFHYEVGNWDCYSAKPPVFLPGESQGQGSLVGCRLWGRTELDTTEVT